MANGTRAGGLTKPQRTPPAAVSAGQMAGGQALPPNTRERIDSRFGWNFADMKIHADTIRAGGAQAALTAVGQAVGLDTARHMLRGSSGQPLDTGTRAEMEQKFGADFADVRVHTGTSSALTAALLGADAWTAGEDIAFGDGRFAPGTAGGKRLLAHELAHVVQQRRGGPAPRPFEPRSAAEQDAGRAASQAVGAGPVAVTGATGRGVAREESATPWWKQRLNPVYQRALEVLPKSAADTLEQANDVAKKWVQETGVTDSHLNDVVKAAEPLIAPVAAYLDVKGSPPPAPKPAAPPIWLGQPPTGVKIQQRRAQQAAQTKLDDSEPGALAPPIQKPTVSDYPPLDVLLRPDPPPTTFETSLKAGKPFTIKIYPKPDIDPSKAVWAGKRPSDARMRNMQFTDADGSSRGIWVDDGKGMDLTVNPDSTMPIRDPTTHELRGYRVRNGDTMTILNRSGGLVGSRNLEAPLEHPMIDPIDIAMLGADVGPLIAKGVTAGGKALIEGAAKYGTREAGKLGTDEVASISGREAADALKAGVSRPPALLDINPGGGNNAASPGQLAETLSPNAVLADANANTTQVVTEQTLKPASTSAIPSPEYTPPSRQLAPHVERPWPADFAKNVGSHGEAVVERDVLQNFLTRSRQMSAKSAGFDAFEGARVSASTTIERGTTIVEETISGGNWTSIKGISDARTDLVVDNVNKAMERAANGLKGLAKNKFERTGPKMGYRTVYGGPPDRITIFLRLDKGLVTKDLVDAARDAVKNSVYLDDLPPVQVTIVAH